MGFQVRILPERTWVSLSPHVRVLTLSDYNQDSILLIDVGGRLLVNLNDASDRGWGRFLKSVTAQYKQSYLLRLWGYGDADMNNLFTESGERITNTVGKPPLGRTIQADALRLGSQYAIPFSSFIVISERTASGQTSWAYRSKTILPGSRRELAPSLAGVSASRCGLRACKEIAPRSLDQVVLKPEEFGDNWADRLTRDDKQLIHNYFLSKEVVRQKFGFLRFRVGGEDFIVDLEQTPKRTGITFEVPRHSLVNAVQYRVFDDLMIGNFMKTTLHGSANLYPDFTPYVAKYADNGRRNKGTVARILPSLPQQGPNRP